MDVARTLEPEKGVIVLQSMMRYEGNARLLPLIQQDANILLFPGSHEQKRSTSPTLAQWPEEQEKGRG
jgi:hypothetical protein